MEWEVVIGLETHTQLQNQIQDFFWCSIAFGAEPNTQANAVSIALPGVLPVLNKEAVHCAIKFGLAMNAEIAPRSVFARKNYFYPDLPKGYQISQYELPVVGKGSLTSVPALAIQRMKKSSTSPARIWKKMPVNRCMVIVEGMTGIDLNRAGTPLLEIVTEPDMRSAAEAVAYAKETARTGAMDRYLRRQYARRQLSLRRQRFGAPQRHGQARYTPRDQEPQLVQVHAAGD